MWPEILFEVSSTALSKKQRRRPVSVTRWHLTKQLGKWLSLRALHAVIKLLKAFVVISFALLWGLWGHLGIPAGEIGRDRKSHAASGSSWAHKHNQSNDSSSQKASATFALCIFLYLMSIFRRDGIFLSGRLLGIRTQKLVWQQIVAGSWFLTVHAPFLNTFFPQDRQLKYVSQCCMPPIRASVAAW